MADTRSLWFVIVSDQSGNPVPLTYNDNGDMAVFDTDTAATAPAKDNPLGKSCGYEVYEWNPD